MHEKSILNAACFFCLFFFFFYKSMYPNFNLWANTKLNTDFLFLHRWLKLMYTELIDTWAILKLFILLCRQDVSCFWTLVQTKAGGKQKKWHTQRNNSSFGDNLLCPSETYSSKLFFFPIIIYVMSVFMRDKEQVKPLQSPTWKLGITANAFPGKRYWGADSGTITHKTF